MEDSWAKQDAALFGLPVRREVYQGVAAQAAPADDVALALRRSSADERRSAAARADTSDDAALAAALGRSLAADAGDAAGDAALARALAANDARRGADDARCYDSDAALAALLAASDSASDLRPEARHEDGWPHDGPGGRGPHDGPGPSSREPQKDVSFEGARREACEKIAEIRSLCAAAGVGRFVDPDFGPGSRSQTDTAGGARAWRRPEELQFDGDRRLPTGFFSPRTPACWRVFDGQPRAADVRQGAVGDCWFVSALSALASFRNGALIRRLFAGAADFDDGRGGGDAKNFGAHAVQLCPPPRRAS